MKQKLLFVIDSLGCGGAEKSLVTLLSLIDYSKYEVDLQLISYGGEFEIFVPKQVNILPSLEYFKFTRKSLLKQILSFDIKKIFARINFSLSIRRKNLSHADRARILYNKSSRCIPKSAKNYDVAIAYGHNFPTFYVAEKISAKKKCAWVNAILRLSGINLSYQRRYYDKIDNIVTVSDGACSNFKTIYPEFASKTSIIYDIIDADFIHQMANQFTESFNYYNGIKLLTVSRLEKQHKGLDITLEVCNILHKRGIDFKWYAIGDGSYRSEMEQFIDRNDLHDCLILLGKKANPYPYFKACDLYVQTSRHEGFGLSIAEARMLNKPVVTTEFDAVWNQMIQWKNGIVVSLDPIKIADAIQDLIDHPEKREAISSFQRNEKKGNTEELQKFYALLNS